MKKYKYIGTIEQIQEFGYIVEVSVFDNVIYATSSGHDKDRLFIVFDEKNPRNRLIQYNWIPRNTTEEIDKKLILDLLFNDLVEEFEVVYDVNKY